MKTVQEGAGATTLCVLFYALAWSGSVAFMAQTGGDWSSPVEVFVLFALVCGSLAWLTTRGSEAPAIQVARPYLETWVFIVYLGFYAVAFLGFGMSAARAALPAGRLQELLVMALKLGAHLALPCGLLLALGAPISPLFQLGLKGRKFWRTLIVLSVVLLGLLSLVSPSLQHIMALEASPQALLALAPLSFAWIAVEAGLNEEFLFRAVVQTRLSALLKSPIAAICLTALLFGLAHAPGLYLRGGLGDDGASHNLALVIAYAIGVLSPLGLLFGVIYARTKSLLLVVLLHGVVDVLPNLPEFIRTWQ